MGLRQLFGWLTRREETPAALPPASDTPSDGVVLSGEMPPRSGSTLPIIDVALPSAPPPVVEVTAPPAVVVDPAEPVRLPATAETAETTETTETTDIASTSAPAAEIEASVVTVPAERPLVVATDAVLVGDEAGADWRGAGYFSRAGARGSILAPPRFKAPIEAVRGDLERFRRARVVALPPPSQPVAAVLAAPTVAPLDFLPALPSPPEQRGAFLPAIDPALFTAFFLDREQPGRPADVYMRWPTVLDAAGRLLESLVDSQRSSPPRLSADALYAAAVTHVADPPSALLVCHNVTRAAARGSPALALARIDPDHDVWDFHGSRVAPEQGRLFYRMFDPGSFGTSDAGDWYRFFGIASAAAFAASRLLVRLPATTTAPIVADVDAIGRSMLVGEPVGAVAAAQAWTNALAWCEWTRYARSPDVVTSSITAAARAFCFGVRAAGGVTGPVRWRVPAPPEDAAGRRVDAGMQIVERPPC